MTSELLHRTRAGSLCDLKSPLRKKNHRAKYDIQNVAFFIHFTAFTFWLTMREKAAANDIYHVIEWKFQLKKEENCFFFLLFAIKKKKNCGKIFSMLHMTSPEWISKRQYFSLSPHELRSYFSFRKYRFLFMLTKAYNGTEFMFYPNELIIVNRKHAVEKRVRKTFVCLAVATT